MGYGSSTFPEGLFPFDFEVVRRRFNLGGAREIMHGSVLCKTMCHVSCVNPFATFTYVRFSPDNGTC